MAFFVWFCFTLSILQASQCYVLLTANVEDVHAIANQVVNSPVVKEIKDTWRRASETFRKHYETPEERSMQMRAHAGNPGQDDSSHESSKELKDEQRKAKEELAALGRDATVYVKSIEGVIESL